MRRGWVIWGAAGLALLAVAAVATALYTDRSPFCRSCHEMRPYYEAWAASAHEDAACIDCHVDEGLPARFAHKFVALGEVRAHLAGDTDFPKYGAEVPDRRCRRCHEEPGPEEPPEGFSHAEHAETGPCRGCHARVGHPMTFEALERADVLDAEAAREHRDYYAPLIDLADGDPAALARHRDEGCQGCHDMSSAGCGYCHEPPEKHFTLVTCDRCHDPGRPFERAEFAHSPTLDCGKCHEPPGGHFPGVVCRECHDPETPFERAIFRHPAIPGGEHSPTSFPCVDCHPNGFRTATCVKCHEGGVPEED